MLVHKWAPIPLAKNGILYSTSQNIFANFMRLRMKINSGMCQKDNSLKTGFKKYSFSLDGHSRKRRGQGAGALHPPYPLMAGSGSRRGETETAEQERILERSIFLAPPRLASLKFGLSRLF